jgi:hypothetical protein
VAKGEDADAIQSAHDSLEQAAHGLSKVLYEQQSQQRAGGTTEGDTAAGGEKPADDTIDAEFEVKND